MAQPSCPKPAKDNPRNPCIQQTIVTADGRQQVAIRTDYPSLAAARAAAPALAAKLSQASGDMVDVRVQEIL